MISTPILFSLLLVVDSLHFVFARLLLPQADPAVSVFLVLAVATVEVGVYGLATKRLTLKGLRPHLAFLAAIGLLVAVSTRINYEAVAYVDPGTASLLAQTGVLFGLALGVVWLKERLDRRQAVGAALAVLGVAVIEYRAGEYLRLGSLLVITSALLYSLHTALTKRFGGEMDFTNFFFCRLLFTSGFLALFLLPGGEIAWPGPGAWPLLLLVGTTDVVLSRALYYVALRRLSLSLHTIVLTLSPAAAVLWALGLFGELPAVQQLAGGAIVLAGVFITMQRRPFPNRQSSHP